MSVKMNCPKCGAAMNHHCDKLVYAVPANDGKDALLLDGGALLEFHFCPSCGSSGTRACEE
jgi:predicted RNA-binding Zn-ribbon protein involved in translation (DUF1610 family)